jgi:hypothetical protein
MSLEQQVVILYEQAAALTRQAAALTKQAASLSQLAASLANQSNTSRLLALPVEVRLKILKMRLASNLTVHLRPLFPSEIHKRLSEIGLVPTRAQRSEGSAQEHSGQVLQVCKKLYHEGIGILYAQNTFDLTSFACTTTEPAVTFSSKNVKLITQMKIPAYILYDHDVLKAFDGLKTLILRKRTLSPFRCWHSVTESQDPLLSEPSTAETCPKGCQP